MSDAVSYVKKGKYATRWNVEVQSYPKNDKVGIYKGKGKVVLVLN
jgi:hypothetical protein